MWTLNVEWNASTRKCAQDNTNKQTSTKKTRFIASPLNSHFTRILCVLHRQYANEPVALLWTISFNRTTFFSSLVNTSTHTNIMTKRKWYLESKYTQIKLEYFVHYFNFRCEINIGTLYVFINSMKILEKTSTIREKGGEWKPDA